MSSAQTQSPLRGRVDKEADASLLMPGAAPAVVGLEADSNSATTVEGVRFQPKLTAPGSSTQLILVGAGRRDVKLPNGMDLKVTCIGIYADSEIVNHLSAFKGKGEDLQADDQLVRAFLEAPVVKMARVSFLIPLRGEEYAAKSGEMTTAALKKADLFSATVEKALQDFATFLKTKQCMPGSSLFFTLTEAGLQISHSINSSIPREAEITIECPLFGAGLISTMISVDGVSPSTRKAFVKGTTHLLQSQPLPLPLQDPTVAMREIQVPMKLPAPAKECLVEDA